MTIQQEYEARLNRVNDAVHLIEPDRVPIVPQVQAFPLQLSGFTVKECLEDVHKAGAAYDAFYNYYKPDLGRGPVLFYPSKYMEQIGINFLRWPGNQIKDPNLVYQFIECDYMKENEYPEAIRDFSKYMMNKWIPRCFSKLSGFSKIDFRNVMWFGHLGFLENLADPEVKNSIYNAIKAGETLVEWEKYIEEYTVRMKTKFGIPICEAGSAFAPFDMIGDSMRGTTEILMDMYDQPENLLELIDLVTDFAIEDTIKNSSGKAVPYVWFWLHKGLDSFMSDECFKKFYWPSLRKYCEALVKADLVPVLYAEGNYDSRLEYFRELPEKKCIVNFEYVDMKKAKKILGGHTCIAGNVPPTLLSHGKPEEVENYCKWLIDTCAPGGGFIMDTAVIVDDALPENMEAMFKTTFEYGKYK